MDRPKNKPSSKEEALKSLPEELHPIFKQFVSEYQFHCIQKYRSAFVSFHILAELIRDGWRPTHKPFVELESSKKEKKTLNP